MEIKITKNPQSIVIYKINPNKQEIEGGVDFDRNVHGRVMVGNFFICNNALIIKDNDGVVTGVFSLDHHYFLKPSNL